MKQIVILLTMFIGIVCAAEISKSEQLIVVTTKGWNENSGTLQRYEKQEGHWKSVGKPIAIHLGRNGLGWGIGLHTIPKDAPYVKHEGDGRAPAGIFALKQAFGYEPFDVKYPYSVYKETDHCVDDVHSKLYNKIVDSTKVDVDYKSKERMKFPKNYYKYGVVVNHNHIDEEGAVPGAGSCIFIHIKDVPTAGCTVMDESQMKELIKWLEKQKQPLLIQAPQSEIKKLTASFRL